MKINPSDLPEFRNWMRERLKQVAPVPEATDLVETKVLIEAVSRMMKSAQWPIIADAADRAESDIVDTIQFDPESFLELDDEFERPFYEEFLRSRITG
jgi:hypothetical protein